MGVYFEDVLGSGLFESGDVSEDSCGVFAAGFDVAPEFLLSHFLRAARTDVLGLLLEVHQYLILSQSNARIRQP